MKNKLLVICSIVVIISILLLPSIPAIQIKSIENNVQKVSIEKNDILNFKEWYNRLNSVNSPKHPILFFIVKAIYISRIIRVMILLEISTEYHDEGWHQYYEIIHPLLAFRGFWLYVTCDEWLTFWSNLSDTYGWNWYI